VSEIEKALEVLDAIISRAKEKIWLGAEPTFTDRFSTAIEWKTGALGGDKEARARLFARLLAAMYPGSIVLRTLGRQYPGEVLPRWSIGIYRRRDEQPIWDGPPDAFECAGNPEFRHHARGLTDHEPHILHRFREELARAMRANGNHVSTDLPDDKWGSRLLFTEDAVLLRQDWSANKHAARPPVQSVPIPQCGQEDVLAARGVFLVLFRQQRTDGAEARRAVQVELPAFPCVSAWLAFADMLGRAAAAAGIERLVLTGFPPPVDETVAWTTVTPDPGVLEVNMAPCQSGSEYLAEQRLLHETAARVGLSPTQLLYNGEEIDSGGGQHLTIGGPSPEESPFLTTPHLLPRLIGFLNHHPSLSYWFAVRSVGSGGQQPRADEVSAESIDGLSVALDKLFRSSEISLAALWGSLAPFMCDRFGNSHRCEVNVEKLWSPQSVDRGRLGLVELRAFRMPGSPEQAAALAAFVRALIAWLAQREDPIELIDWGRQLHDRFSLPYYLRRDLDDVLQQMARSGFDVGAAIASLLLDDSSVMIATRDLEGARLKVRQATEFWPLVGGLTDQSQPSRVMDSSTSRIEISLELDDRRASDLEPWELSILGYDIPWVVERACDSTVLLRGVRYKAFEPLTPTLPLVAPIDPVEFTLTSTKRGKSWRCRLFYWRPDGGNYDGLPRDLEEARMRRSERLVVDPVDREPTTVPVPSRAMTQHFVDLRMLM
jgi:uncharacterized protein (DUF2126 family)